MLSANTWAYRKIINFCEKLQVTMSEWHKSQVQINMRKLGTQNIKYPSQLPAMIHRVVNLNLHNSHATLTCGMMYISYTWHTDTSSALQHSSLGTSTSSILFHEPLRTDAHAVLYHKSLLTSTDRGGDSVHFSPHTVAAPTVHTFTYVLVRIGHYETVNERIYLLF